jgi:hypothetical protein
MPGHSLNVVRPLIALIAILLAVLACIPPQDCQLVNVSISGAVQDESRQPVSGAQISIISNKNTPYRDINLLLASNGKGRFSYKNLSIFQCQILDFEVTAAGFQATKKSFYVIQGLSESMPSEIKITLKSAIGG